MGRTRRRVVGPIVLSLLSLGASCGDKSSRAGEGTESREARAGAEERAPEVESLPQVDASELTDVERGVWVGLINDQLSPCGEPVSVGRCAKENRRCGQCVPAARYLARLVTEGYERAQIEDMYSLRYGRDTAVELEIDHAPVRGAPMAPVTIVTFSDFECHYCGRAHPILRRALRELEGKVRLVFLNFPLSAHEHAQAAAAAAIAAGNQGKFWEMHDLLFENQAALEAQDLERYATQLGLDLERFRTDVEARETRERIDRDREHGVKVGVEGTPSIFVNGRAYAEPPEALLAYLREELDQ
jgi:protein-disulfide isomerase